MSLPKRILRSTPHQMFSIADRHYIADAQGYLCEHIRHSQTVMEPGVHWDDAAIMIRNGTARAVAPKNKIVSGLRAPIAMARSESDTAAPTPEPAPVAAVAAAPLPTAEQPKPKRAPRQKTEGQE